MDSIKKLLKVITPIIIRGAAACISVLLSIVVGRVLGVEGAGYFFLALSVLAYLNAISRGGMDQTLIRLIARSPKQGQKFWQRLFTTSLLTTSIVSIFCGSGAVVVVFYFLPNEGSQMQDAIVIASMCVVPTSITWINAGILQGMRKINLAMFFQTAFTPLLTVPVILITSDVRGALLVYFVASTITCIFSILAIQRLLGWQVFAAKPIFAKKFFSSSANLAVASLMNALQNWLPLTLAAVFVSPYDVGLYAAALRLSSVGALVLTALNAYAAPAFARESRRANLREFQTKVNTHSSLGFALGLPLVLCLFVMPSSMLSLFGAEFKDAAYILMILTVGQLVIFATGGGSTLLAMTGHDRDLRMVTVASVGVMAVLSSIGLYLSGSVLIAAAVTSLVVAFQNIWICVLVKKRLSITAWFDPFILFNQIGLNGRK